MTTWLNDQQVLADLRSDLATAKRLLASQVAHESERCSFDHNGDCQEHGCFHDLVGQTYCSVAEARAFLGLELGQTECVS